VLLWWLSQSWAMLLLCIGAIIKLFTTSSPSALGAAVTNWKYSCLKTVERVHKPDSIVRANLCATKVANPLEPWLQAMWCLCYAKLNTVCLWIGKILVAFFLSNCLTAFPWTKTQQTRIQPARAVAIKTFKQDSSMSSPLFFLVLNMVQVSVNINWKYW